MAGRAAGRGTGDGTQSGLHPSGFQDLAFLPWKKRMEQIYDLGQAGREVS